MTRACSSCEWWMSGRREMNPASGNTGMCKAAPPVSVGDGHIRWPTTAFDDWCGAYRRSEASIRSGSPGAEEILKHFDKEGRA